MFKYLPDVNPKMRLYLQLVALGIAAPIIYMIVCYAIFSGFMLLGFSEGFSAVTTAMCGLGIVAATVVFAVKELEL